MKRSMTSRDRADILLDQGFTWLAGKWFKGKEEFPDVRRELLTNQIYKSREPDDAEKAMAYFIGAYGDPRGKWPLSPIVAEGMQYLKNHDNGLSLPPMAYPLGDPQLLILNRLLYGGEEYMFILTGTGGSGKSTVGNIVIQVFGSDCAFLNLGELSDDFHLAMGAGKRLIYSDELNAEAMASNVIKTLVSKQDLAINPKFGKPYMIRWQGNLFFCCNRPPKMDISDPGLLRRICYYYMDKRIVSPDPTMQKREYSKEELTNFVAHALMVPTQNWFETYFRSDTHKALRSVNSVWLTRMRHHGDYQLYKTACSLSNYKPYAEDKFLAVWQVFQDWEEEDRRGGPLPF